MPNTRMNKQKWTNHFQYNKWSYVLVLFLAYMVGDLLFTMTAYRPPNERKVEVELVGAYADIEAAAGQIQVALEAGQAYELARDQAAGIDTAAEDYEVPLQEVVFYSLNYDPEADDETSYYGAQKYMVTLAAQEGDIFILSRDLMDSLVEQGTVLDLKPYIEAGIIDPGERDLSRVTYPEYVEEGMEPTNNECVYALQAESLTGLMETMLFDVTDKYMVIMAYSKNPDTSAVVLQSLIDQFEKDVPEAAVDGEAGE